jgi:heme exporter protein D
MHWHSTTEFFAMGGHALYVWGSFGACALGLLIEPLLLRRERGQLLHRLRAQLDAESDPR